MGSIETAVIINTMKETEGIVVIITGGSKGIGRSIAQDLFDKGASISLCSRKIEDVEKACSEIDPTGERVCGKAVDVSKVDDCNAFIHLAIEKFGKVDVLINNAGVCGDISEFENGDVAKWTETLMTNVFGTIYCTRAVLPLMKKAGKGKIINLAGAGVGGKKPLVNFSSYYTSKMAIVGFTETVAEELVISNSNIQMNCIAPGAINTGITDHILEQGPEKVGEDMYNRTLEQKSAQGGEVSLMQVNDLVTFLSTSASDHVTGRLISAKWDSIDALKVLPKGGDMYKLRRIDNDLFYGK